MIQEVMGSLVAERDRILAEKLEAEKLLKAKEEELQQFKEDVYFKVMMDKIEITLEDGFTAQVDSRKRLELFGEWLKLKEAYLSRKAIDETWERDFNHRFWMEFRPDDPEPEWDKKEEPPLPPAEPVPVQPVVLLKAKEPEQHEILSMRRRGSSIDTIAAYYQMDKEQVKTILLQP